MRPRRRSSGSRETPSRATSGVAATLRSLGVRPSRRLGQSFLIDPRVAERIAALVEDPAAPVLEIGPGLGALTERLALTGRRVVAVELDRRLAEYLERASWVTPRVAIVRGDILEQSVPGLMAGDTPCTVLGNLPYAITTPILEWLLAEIRWVRRAFLMVQREVAERIAAAPGARECGSMTITMALHAEVRALFHAPPGAFVPRPDVGSRLIDVSPRPYPGTHEAERAAVERITRAAMGARRKTLANALARGLAVAPSEARAILESAGVEAGRRGETLDVAEWIAVTRACERTGRGR